MDFAFHMLGNHSSMHNCFLLGLVYSNSGSLLANVEELFVVLAFWWC